MCEFKDAALIIVETTKIVMKQGIASFHHRNQNVEEGDSRSSFAHAIEGLGVGSGSGLAASLKPGIGFGVVTSTGSISTSSTCSPGCRGNISGGVRPPWFAFVAGPVFFSVSSSTFLFSEMVGGGDFAILS